MSNDLKAHASDEIRHSAMLMDWIWETEHLTRSVDRLNRYLSAPALSKRQTAGDKSIKDDRLAPCNPGSSARKFQDGLRKLRPWRLHPLQQAYRICNHMRGLVTAILLKASSMTPR